MRQVNKHFLWRIWAFSIIYIFTSFLGCAILTKDTTLILVSLCLFLIFLIIAPFTRYNVNSYLINGTYLFGLAFICVLSAIVFTLLPSTNAMHYYGIPTPDNYIALALCTVPFIALFIHMLCHGCKSLDEVAIPFTKTRKKINLDTGEYYMNQKVNILKDITKKSFFYDSKIENFLGKHISIVYRVIMLASGLGPVIPLLISRNFGQQPVNVYFLLCVSYLAWGCAYFLPIVIQMTRTVIYIQKKHNIKLKLAYKKDPIIV